jgi:hypothetical protein
MINFFKVDYLIRVDTHDGLSIRLEQKNNGDMWKNQFSQ